MSNSREELSTVLTDFGVRGTVLPPKEGPVVTLYEFEPAPGVKASRIINLTDDLARAMSAVSCRASVIPGRNVIGIELPNKKRKTVHLDDLFNSPEFLEGKEALPWALGVGIGGETLVVDIAKFPHLLMAGTTGSGKSVAMNTLIASLLKKLPPDECKFVMIDPKQLELAVYANIPHLLMPVVTDPEKAVEALQWTVSEMERRYAQMAQVGVRNISGFNKCSEERMPYLVVVIDEVADLMMVAGKEVERLVQRLAQMARAAGIHLIMATQRPSVDVITGTIKANFPTRISFSVASKFDSRTILGEQGAEQLLGMGDMLFMASGAKPKRAHGAFIDDSALAAFVGTLGAAKTEVSQKVETAPTAQAPSLYDHAKHIALVEGKASAGYLQRRLGVPYLEAFKLTEQLEAEGVVGPADVGGRREVLVPFYD